MEYLIVSLFSLTFAGVCWWALSGLKIKAGWQNGNGFIARWLDDRRRIKFDLQLPDALATMSNALRAGFSISQAFDSVVESADAPMCEEFAILQQQLRIGMGFEDALNALTKRVGSEDLALVSTAIVVSRKTGGNVTEIFDRISGTIHGRQRIERKVRTLTAQGRMQGIIVSAMPVFLGLIMTIIKPQMMIPFLASVTGLAAVAVMLVLIVLGWLIIRKIIRIDI